MMGWMLTLLLLPTPDVPSELDTYFQAGIEAYKQNHYSEARKSFETILNAGFESADLYYNLGNTAYKQKQLGYAVYFFRKALLLDPSHEDAQFNLELTRQHLVDRINYAPDFVAFALAKKWFFGLTRETLYWCALFTWSAFWAAVGFSARWSIPAWMRWASGIVACAIICLLALRLTIGDSREQGIVVADATDAKSEPVEKASTLFLLHAGTEVAIEGHEGEWSEIRLPDGKTGWLRNSALEIL